MASMLFLLTSRCWGHTCCLCCLHETCNRKRMKCKRLNICRSDLHSTELAAVTWRWLRSIESSPYEGWWRPVAWWGYSHGDREGRRHQTHCARNRLSHWQLDERDEMGDSVDYCRTIRARLQCIMYNEPSAQFIFCLKIEIDPLYYLYRHHGDLLAVCFRLGIRNSCRLSAYWLAHNLFDWLSILGRLPFCRDGQKHKHPF